MGIGDFGFCTKARGRCGKFALERAVERRLGCVTDLSGDLRDAVTGGREQLRTQLQPPMCEVGHRWHAEEMPEALGHHRARDSHPPGQFGDGPLVGWLTMYERERVADFRVAGSIRSGPV